MQLKYKPDFEEAAARFDAFWAGQYLDRPPVCIRAPKKDVPQMPYLGHMYKEQYGARTEADFEAVLSKYEDHYLSRTAFLGESMPFFHLSFGPDMYAAFFGAELISSSEANTNTNWVQPIVEDWDQFSGKLDEGENGVLARFLRFMKYAAQYSEGKFLMGVPDTHSNMDAMSALRDNVELCYDLYDCPDEVEEALKKVQSYYDPIMRAVAEAGDFERRGYIGWHHLYCRERYATVQCDFAALCGPAMGERFIYPYVQKEAASHAHCSYHYDGPGALCHIDHILQIPEIDVIQWVPGAGQPKSCHWMDLLKKVQAAGKRLYVDDLSPADIKEHFHELDPRMVCYATNARSEEEAQDLLEFIRKHS